MGANIFVLALQVFHDKYLRYRDEYIWISLLYLLKEDLNMIIMEVLDISHW